VMPGGSEEGVEAVVEVGGRRAGRGLGSAGHGGILATGW
jgi:hypothetical protein